MSSYVNDGKYRKYLPIYLKKIMVSRQMREGSEIVSDMTSLRTETKVYYKNHFIHN